MRWVDYLNCEINNYCFITVIISKAICDDTLCNAVGNAIAQVYLHRLKLNGVYYSCHRVWYVYYMVCNEIDRIERTLVEFFVLCEYIVFKIFDEPFVVSYSRVNTLFIVVWPTVWYFRRPFRYDTLDSFFFSHYHSLRSQQHATDYALRLRALVYVRWLIRYRRTFKVGAEKSRAFRTSPCTRCLFKSENASDNLYPPV